MKAYHLRSHPDIAKMLCNYFDLKAKEKQYLSDISAMENALTTGRQIESTESLIRSIVFARHEHIGGASNRTSDSTYNAVNQLSHEIQAQDKATEDIQRALALRKKTAGGHPKGGGRCGSGPPDAHSGRMSADPHVLWQAVHLAAGV